MVTPVIQRYLNNLFPDSSLGEVSVHELSLDVLTTCIHEAVQEALDAGGEVAHAHERLLVLLAVLVPALGHLLVLPHVLHHRLNTLSHIVVTKGHGNSLRKGGDVSHGSLVVELVDLIQPADLLEHAELISHLLLNLVPDLLHSGALLLSLTLALALASPPHAGLRVFVTECRSLLQLGANRSAHSAHGDHLIILETEAGAEGKGGAQDNQGFHDDL